MKTSAVPANAPDWVTAQGRTRTPTTNRAALSAMRRQKSGRAGVCSEIAVRIATTATTATTRKDAERTVAEPVVT